MASEMIYKDLVSGDNLSTLVNWRINPLSSSSMATLASSLNASHAGLSVFDTDNNQINYWTGAVFLPFLPNRITQLAVNTTLAFNTHRIVECIASNLQITLPSAIGKAGVDFIVKQSNFTNTTILTTSSQTIDGSLSIKLNNPYESRTLVSNNLNWIVV